MQFPILAIKVSLCRFMSVKINKIPINFVIILKYMQVHYFESNSATGIGCLIVTVSLSAVVS